MACCQSGKLHTPPDKEGIWADEKRIGLLASKRGEGRVDLAAGAISVPDSGHSLCDSVTPDALPIDLAS
jgi:hypothetical protein